MASYCHTPSKHPLNFITIPEKIRQFAIEDPEKDAIVFYDSKLQRSSFTRKQLYDETESVAKALVKQGIKKGDRIALCVSNCIEWIAYDSGIMMAGGCSVRLFVGQADFLPMLEDCVAVIFGSEPTFYNKLLKVANILEDGTVISETFPKLRLAITVANTDSEIKGLSLDEMKETAKNDLNIIIPQVDPEDITIIAQTSGSTGKPKRVTHSSFDIINCSEMFCDLHNFTADDAVFNERYFGFGGSYPFTFIAVGCKYVTADIRSIHCPKDFSKLRDLSKIEGCTWLNILPSDLRYCTEGKNVAPNIMTGGDIASFDAVKQGLNWVSLIDYHLSSAETLLIGTVLVTKQNIGDYVPGIIGRVYPNIEAKIVDDKDRIVDIGQAGYLCIRSKWCTKITTDGESVQQNGWFKTRDICKMNENKEIFMVGRDVQFIQKETRKISIVFVEQHMKRHPDIDDVILVPVPDEELELKACACVIMKSGKKFDEKNILQFCRENLPQPNDFDYISSNPDYMVQFDKFPKLLNGKVDRVSVKDMAIKSLIQSHSLCATTNCNPRNKK
ncbi:putative acyl-CoA synthetase YngI [Octopus bimaculoides]|uniref:AMP-dependent synthetase/ligase domain-containing protein n=1 Tax=Octopus bimaculoides TaxID=37653 RepID=A0A0L8GJJ3_OCTBM|nr:putative acyl-CoA synthetase YngI [Octopus bimaculoides]|eukprot:XP_014780452.1 PREDICTED: putative acyl-CoA synthetase YngI [Octopus bimaculoides]